MSESNSLTPPVGFGQQPGGGLGAESAPPHPLAEHLPVLDSAHAQAKAQFAATSKAQGQMTMVLGQLGKLADLGDTVTAEDVIGSASKLVGAGFDPKRLAGLLADMPDSGGSAIQGWVAQQGQRMQVLAQQLDQAHEAARHQLGLSAIHGLMAHSIQGMPGQPQGTAPAPGPGAVAPVTPGLTTAGVNALGGIS